MKLYAPSAIACSVPLFEFVLPLLAKHEVLPKAEVRKAIEVMRALMKREAASPFEQEEFETLQRAFDGMGKETREPKEQ